MLFWLKHLEATITMTPFATQTFKRADVQCVYLSDGTDNMRMFPIRMDTVHHTFTVLCWILHKYTQNLGKIIFTYIYRETAKKRQQHIRQTRAQSFWSKTTHNFRCCRFMHTKHTRYKYSPRFTYNTEYDV